MTTTSSRLALTVTATHRGAGKEAFVHLSRGDSLAMIPLLIFELSGRITRRAALLEASSMGPVQSSDDPQSRLSWCWGRSLTAAAGACRQRHLRTMVMAHHNRGPSDAPAICLSGR